MTYTLAALPLTHRDLNEAIKLVGSARKFAVMTGVGEGNLPAIRQGRRQMPFPVYLTCAYLLRSKRYTLPDAIWHYCLAQDRLGDHWAKLLGTSPMTAEQFNEWAEHRSAIADEQLKAMALKDKARRRARAAQRPSKTAKRVKAV